MLLEHRICKKSMRIRCCHFHYLVKRRMNDFRYLTFHFLFFQPQLADHPIPPPASEYVPSPSSISSYTSRLLLSVSSSDGFPPFSNWWKKKRTVSLEVWTRIQRYPHHFRPFYE